MLWMRHILKHTQQILFLLIMIIAYYTNLYTSMWNLCFLIHLYKCGTWCRIGRVEALRPEGRSFQSRSSRHVGTFDKFLTRSCLWRFGVKLRHSIRAVSGALLSIVADLKRRYRNSLNE